MQKRITSILLTVCLCAGLSACGTTAASLNNAGRTDQASVSGNPDAAMNIPADAPTFNIGFSDKTDANGDPVFLQPDAFHAEHGTVGMNMVTEYTMPGASASDVMPAYVMVGINGDLYDFTLNGKKSSNGLVQIDIPNKTMFSVPLEISGLNLEQGNSNQFVLILVPLSEDEAFHNMGPFLYNAVLNADQSTAGQTTVSIPDQTKVKNLKIETTEGKTEEEILLPNDGITRMFAEEDLAEEPSSDSMQLSVKAGAQLFLQIPNINNGKGPSRRKGICMALDGGQLLNAWAGSPLLKMDLTENDLFVTAPLETEYKAGDTADLWMFYIDLFNSDPEADPFTIASGNLLRFQ